MSFDSSRPICTASSAPARGPVPLLGTRRDGGSFAPRGRLRAVEERLRATAGLERAASLSAWRGPSGRRYVVGIRPLREACEGVEDLADALLIAARRANGEAVLMGAFDSAGAPDAAPLERIRRWLAAMARAGADEIHVHRLAHSREDRRAALDDLAH